MANHMKEKIEITLLLPAVNIVGSSGGIYDSLVIRDRDSGITWNESEVKKHHKDNPTSFLNTMLWRRTVSMSNWHHPIWQEGDMEALRKGDWKTLI